MEAVALRKSLLVKAGVKIEKQKPVTASTVTKRINMLPDIWKVLVDRNPAIKKMATELIHDEKMIKHFTSELIVQGGQQGRINYVAHCFVMLSDAVGEYNALRFFELSPMGVLLALKDAVNYSNKPSLDSPYNLRLQPMILADTIFNVVKDLYPSKYYHGLIEVLGQFNIDEELLDFVLHQCLSKKNDNSIH